MRYFPKSGPASTPPPPLPPIPNTAVSTSDQGLEIEMGLETSPDKRGGSGGRNARQTNQTFRKSGTDAKVRAFRTCIDKDFVLGNIPSASGS